MDISLVVQIVMYITTTLLTYVLGILSKKLKWNEEVPIPVQNIIVGVMSFIICWILCRDIANPETIGQAIITAMSGVGTATIVYDTKKNIKERK